MKLRAFLHGAGKITAIIAAALLLLFAVLNSPLWPRHAHADGKAPEAEKKGEGKKEDGKADAAKSSGDDKNALHHVMDNAEFELFEAFPPYAIHLPKIGDFQITKFMVLELIAAVLIAAIYIPLARRMANGEVVRGPFFNFFEVLLTFVRDQIAKPSIGDKEADRYVPFLWTMFLFILFNNLLGMVPFGGSATASIIVTGALALIVFVYMHGSAIAKTAREAGHGHGHDHGNDHGHDHGPDHGAVDHAPRHATIGEFFTVGLPRYVASLWPGEGVPLAVKPLIFVIEWVGVIVRNAVLAVRLFANMFAGHMVLATLLLFIYMARNVDPLLWGSVTLGSVLGIVALSLLELFIAFLQAYIFTFLTALFMGMALNPEH
jgi:F-type H+-transporting ATPase subunit a